MSSKWTIHINLKLKTIKFLEKNLGEILHDLGLDKGVLDMTPKEQSIKEKNLMYRTLSKLKILL